MTKINHRKLVRAQITPEQHNKLLALVATQPYGITIGVYAAQLLITELTEVTTK